MNNDFFNQLENNNKKTKYILEKQSKIEKTENTIAVIIKVIAFLSLLIGLIVGIVVGNANGQQFDSLKMLEYWLIFCGCALGCFALAEIIQLLQDIKDRLSYKNDDIKE